MTSTLEPTTQVTACELSSTEILLWLLWLQVDLTVWTVATATWSQDIKLSSPWGCPALHFLLLLVLVRLEFFLFAAILRTSPSSSSEEGSELGMLIPDAVIATIVFWFCAIRLLICLFWVAMADLSQNWCQHNHQPWGFASVGRSSCVWKCTSGSYCACIPLCTWGILALLWAVRRIAGWSWVTGKWASASGTLHRNCGSCVIC